jgi:PTH1 family peptidyl-tRNA hydrolase
MHLIVGLGNPGKKYEKTRHNVGFLVVDELAKQLGMHFTNKTSLEAEIAVQDHPLTSSFIRSGKTLTLLKPQTFMNMSGRAVKKFFTKHHLQPSDLLVVYDDADLPFGEIRFKTSGSSGGHNGMQSILEQFPKGTAVSRMRIGIGRPINPDIPLDQFVLQPWTKEEEKTLPDIMKKVIHKITERITSLSNSSQ